MGCSLETLWTVRSRVSRRLPLCVSSYLLLAMDSGLPSGGHLLSDSWCPLQAAPAETSDSAHYSWRSSPSTHEEAKCGTQQANLKSWGPPGLRLRCGASSSFWVLIYRREAAQYSTMPFWADWWVGRRSQYTQGNQPVPGTLFLTRENTNGPCMPPYGMCQHHLRAGAGKGRFLPPTPRLIPPPARLSLCLCFSFFVLFVCLFISFPFKTGFICIALAILKCTQ